MSQSEVKTLLVAPADAGGILKALSRGLLEYLRDEVGKTPGAELGRVGPGTLSVAVTREYGGQAVVEVVRVDTAAVEGGRLAVRGFAVIDPEDQAVDGGEADLSEADLLGLPAEALASVVAYFTEDATHPRHRAALLGVEFVDGMADRHAGELARNVLDACLRTARSDFFAPQGGGDFGDEPPDDNGSHTRRVSVHLCGHEASGDVY